MTMEEAVRRLNRIVALQAIEAMARTDTSFDKLDEQLSPKWKKGAAEKFVMSLANGDGVYLLTDVVAFFHAMDVTLSFGVSTPIVRRGEPVRRSTKVFDYSVVYKEDEPAATPEE